MRSNLSSDFARSQDLLICVLREVEAQGTVFRGEAEDVPGEAISTVQRDKLILFAL